ncbi:MAG: NAD(P)/FAD-dependent oxidoreductase [Gammaproteobacteria bacterium]|nr:NAD(P)/FAD-dependent oxidoreductase [Rhodocyclaceae bacterium]MBU3910334.1 NAD(P)/FAD-dependent oxidoreductase [Gammaproteobacteria bacterium]MBU3990264.1 NAD(P)/FAD-dependent oxidoreductase [Gammaproteobacteria bacterium]MBU4004161.1 NAD(P)/FAD-dependent oxidoreductase [Gammaproteobacteria bacterium]MBU4020408.1 NAD(P)/FAD-dependent oxidoreductase [Gammaproteobacteria bacterium]
MVKRRDFIKWTGAAGIGLTAAGWSALAAADDRRTRTATTSAFPTTGIKGRVVVIGGGMGGATVAKYLRFWGGTGVDVTLIERDSAYTSSIMSNLVLNGSRTINSLQFGYGNLASRYGVKIVKGEVVTIDPVGRAVTLASGTRYAYDRLVVAPGVDFDVLPGLETAAAQAKVPHAWTAGPQTTALRNMITAMPAGGVFVMSIPAKPIRCPPGPYERACVVADWLKRNRSGAKVIVLDANASIMAEEHSFLEGFALHGVEYRPGVSINSVDAATLTLNTSEGNVRGNVLNVIPPHRAGKVIAANGLADAGGRWSNVDVLSYETRIAPGIHVIGDASATTQPKAGHIANQEAKVCADAILRLLSGRAPDPSPHTNSACYSPITFETASWLTVNFAYDPVSKTMQPVPASAGEAATRSKDNFEEMNKWFTALMGDSFA